MKDDKVHYIREDKEGKGSRVLALKYYNYLKRRPEIPTIAPIINEKYASKEDIAIWNKWEKDLDQWTKLKKPQDHKIPEKDGGGDGSMITLSFKKSYVQSRLKEVGVRRRYLVIVTAHELRHAVDNKRGINRMTDSNNKGEINTTVTQNKTAEEMNRFRLFKFPTNIDQYNVLRFKNEYVP